MREHGRRISSMFARFHVALVVVALTAPLGMGCSDPCKKLVKKLCDEMKDDRACQEWAERVKTVDKETCEASLQALKAATR
jgi:hypothetical protein